MAGRIVRIVLVIVLASFAGWGMLPAAHAAPPMQGTLGFDDEQPATGALGPGADQALFAFDCRQDAVGSVHAVTTSGDLEIAIEILSSSNEVFASGGKVGSGPNTSVAEAFVIPVGGMCAVRLSRVGQTQGEYAVRLLPGYAQLDKWDRFDGSTGDLTMFWEPYESAELSVATINEQLFINVTTDFMLGYAVPDGDNLNWSDLYIQADIQIEDTPSYAEYGFLVREDVEADTFYSFTYSSDGDYTLYYFDSEEWQVVQDWTVSSAVDGLAKQARIGLWVQDYTFRAYFDGRLVGEIVDFSQYATEGTISLAAGTGRDQLDPLGVYFDNVIITRPFEKKATLPFGGTGLDVKPTATPTTASTGLTGILGGDPTATATTAPLAFPTAVPTTASLAFPTAAPTTASLTFPTLPPTQPASTAPYTLKTWNSTRAEDIIAELRQAGAIPSGGRVTMTVPSSYGDTSAPDWHFYPLASDRTFRNFVLSFDTRLVNGAASSGCGMSFRDAGDRVSDAMIFADGGALLGEWFFEGVENADLTDATVYSESVNAVIPGVGVTNKVIVVAVEDAMLMYVNGQLFAETRFIPVSGTMALEMYVDSDDSGATQQTYCQLNNVWTWEF